MDTQLEKLTTQPEDHQVDFKQMGVLSGSLKDVAKHLVAFANRRGGILLFGITDSGRIEGKSFGKEKAITRVTDAATDWCSPSVAFSIEYFSSEWDGSKIGDVLKVEVEQAQTTPHAVASGNRQKRQYYIRRGNESRPIGDPKELDWLFTRSLPESISQDFSVWQSYNMENLNPVSPPGIPDGHQYIQQLFSSLSNTDRSYLLNSPDNRVPRLLTELIPFAVLLSLSDTTWMKYADELYSNSTMASEVYDNLQEITIKDVTYSPEPVVEDDPGSVLSEIDINPQSVAADLGSYNINGSTYAPAILFPQGTEIEVTYVAKQLSRIDIMAENRFNFYIHSQWLGSNVISGFPEDFPLYDMVSADDTTMSVQSGLEFEGGLEFPDYENPRLTLDAAFSDGMCDLMVDIWDPGSEIKENWSKIYSIESKVDELLKSDN